MPQPCELCHREMLALTEQHLIPRQKMKRKWIDPSPTIQICSACRRQIHTLYDKSHLALHLNNLEKLKQDPQLQKFLTWVHKQDPNKRVKMVQIFTKFGFMNPELLMNQVPNS